jgi:tagatose-6-phosphate ketose/aldose isomerase
MRNPATTTSFTWSEIGQQPELWPTTIYRVQEAAANLQLSKGFDRARVLITGAGTSAYAASAIASVWPEAISVPSTDLLIDTGRHLRNIDILISVARSGNSPESLAVIERIHRLRPEIVHLAICCNGSGALATSPLVQAIILDPRTDDRSLVMTSSFSNLVLAGICLIDPDAGRSSTQAACVGAAAKLDSIDRITGRIAALVQDRILLLASPPLFPWALEGSLKALEMTAGKFPVMAETYLGLRHGPMSFLRSDTLVLCLLSNEPSRRRYEEDLIRELRRKNLGYLVGITAVCDGDPGLFDTVLPPMLPTASDAFRTPFEIVAPQLLGYNLSMRAGLNPDSPSPEGVINRVVQGVHIHEFSSELSLEC